MALVKLKTHRCPTSSHLTEALEKSCQAGVCGVHCVYALCVYVSTVDVPPQINVNGMHALLIRSVVRGRVEGFENLQLMMLQLLLLMSCKTLNEWAPLHSMAHESVFFGGAGAQGIPGIPGPSVQQSK